MRLALMLFLTHAPFVGAFAALSSRQRPRAVGGAFDDSAMMESDGRVDEVAAQAAQLRKRALFVSAGEPAVADDVCDKNRGELSGLAHSCGSPAFNQFREVRCVRNEPLHGKIGVESQRFRKGCLRLFPFALQRVDGG